MIKRPVYFSAGLAILLAAGAALQATSAQAADVPASVDAGRQPVPQPPRPQTEITGPRPVLQSQAPQLAANIASHVFRLKSVAFEGATAFSQAELMAPFAPLLGQEVRVADLFAAMSQLQQKYLDAGYALSRVDMPPQNIDSGRVTIRVTEGYVSDVVIDDSLQQSALVQDVARRLRGMRPLDTRMMERLMLVLAARPGDEATALLAPDDSTDHAPGAVRLYLRPRKDADKTRSYISLDNQGSNYLGPWRVGAGTRLARVLGSDADIGLSAMGTATSSELRQGSVDAAWPVCGASGAVATISGGFTRTQPGGSLQPLDVDGTSKFWQAGISYPIILQRDVSWSVAATFDYKNVATDLLQARVFNDHLRIGTLQTSYAFADRWLGSNSVSLAYSQGFDILNPRPADATDISRADGKSRFRKAVASASRLQPLFGAVDLLAQLQAQYAWDPLLSSEEFGYGGAGIGRGYDSSELVGDHGVAGLLELRYTRALPDYGTVAQPYAFYDLGKVWNIDPSARNRASGASAGGGLRLSLPQDTDMDLGVAVPLTRPTDNPPNYSNKSGTRVLLRVQKNF